MAIINESRVKSVISELEAKKDKSIEENLKLGNLKRLLSLKEKKAYCRLEKRMLNMEEITSKCLPCQNGVIFECHHPYEHHSKYCNHVNMVRYDLNNRLFGYFDLNLIKRMSLTQLLFIHDLIEVEIEKRGL